MNKKKIVLGAAFAVMSSLMVAGPASAAHCVSPGDLAGVFVLRPGRQGRR